MGRQEAMVPWKSSRLCLPAGLWSWLVAVSCGAKVGDDTTTSFLNAVKPAVPEDPFAPDVTRIYLTPNGTDAGQVSAEAQDIFARHRRKVKARLNALSSWERSSIEALFEDGMQVSP